MNKVIFLDFDGPLIPVRAYFLPGQNTGKVLGRDRPVATVFDPVAVSLVNRLITLSGAKLVISSTWGSQGLDVVTDLLAKNDIVPTHLHDDWVTTKKLTSHRHHEIKWWLDDHPEVTHYVAIDDSLLHADFVPNAVFVNTYDGFSFRNYLQAMLYLNAFDKDLADTDPHEEYEIQVDYMRRLEVGHAAHGHAQQFEIENLIEEMYPNKKSTWYKKKEE